MPKDVEFVLEGLRSSIGRRHAAAEVLRKVADDGSWGGFPSDVTCEQIGRALFRICINSPEGKPLLEIVNGWMDAEIERDLQHSDT